MGRLGLIAILLLAAGTPPAATQALSTLHITVTLSDGAGTTTPVARHALLISAEPPLEEPRRIVTTLAGTFDVRLPPGHYVVESDQPVAFQGKNYEWSQRLEIVAGRDATLALTAANASAGATTAAAASVTPSETNGAVLASQWQATVVGLWAPARHASGFVTDARGLIVTTPRAIGNATTVEAQFAPDVRVRATVLASDPVRDIAILWVNPSVVASLRPLPLGCGQPGPTVTNDQELYTIGTDLTGHSRLTVGDVIGTGPRQLLSDLRLGRSGAGGPVFATGGLIGLTTIDDRDADTRETRVVRVDQACDAMAAAVKKMAEAAAPPEATQLPPDRGPVAERALIEAMKGRAGSLGTYPMNTADFDVTFITPLQIYAAKDRGRSPVLDFDTWSDYFADYPRVLIVRATPKLAEGLLAKVARGAAMTQGVALPPLKRPKAGFLRMRAFCGDAEVTPIHPFVIEHRVSDKETINEGLYVFDPAALAPTCGGVKLTLYPEDDPAKGDTRVVDDTVLQQIARDFQPL